MNEIIKLTNQLQQSKNEQTSKSLGTTLLRCFRTLPAKTEHDIVSIFKTDRDKLTCLRAIRREVGEMGLNALMVLIITDVVLFFNVGKTMTPEQIAQTVQLILEDYEYLCVEDFKVCFNNAKKGVYGKLYDRIDGAIILEWVETYAQQREKAFIESYSNPPAPVRDRTGILEEAQSVAQIAAREFNNVWEN